MASLESDEMTALWQNDCWIFTFGTSVRRSSGRRSGVVIRANNVVATIFISLFFPPFFFPPSYQKTYLAKVA